MLTLFFSGTGNTAYIADLFSRKMNAVCMGIEDTIDFAPHLQEHDTIAICYPIYGSRVPLIMRQFVSKHMSYLQDKRLIILVTQMLFSGDGARVLCDLFPKMPNVIYAEHILMPNNVSNFALFNENKNVDKILKKAKIKVDKICNNIQNGVVKKRGFSKFAKFLGNIQGKHWQGNSKNAFTQRGTVEYDAQHSVRIDDDCNICEICVKVCPTQNLHKTTRGEFYEKSIKKAEIDIDKELDKEIRNEIRKTMEEKRLAEIASSSENDSIKKLNNIAENAIEKKTEEIRQNIAKKFPNKEYEKFSEEEKKKYFTKAELFVLEHDIKMAEIDAKFNKRKAELEKEMEEFEMRKAAREKKNAEMDETLAKWAEKPYIISYHKCTTCYRCVNCCPQKAISLFCNNYAHFNLFDVDEKSKRKTLYQKLKRKLFYGSPSWQYNLPVFDWEEEDL